MARPILADSGNGAHSLYRIDLPNDAESADLLKRCLQALSLRFSDGVVKVDEAVFNPARIWKVYGTIACKGDSTADRPHRQSKLLQVPDELEAVSLDKLKALADTVPKPSQRDAGYSGKQFDLDRWISDHGLDVVGPLPWGGGGHKWIFHECPWNPAHIRKAYIVELPSGAIAAGCQHESCKGNWETLRAKYEPEYRKDREESGKGNGAAGTHQKGPEEFPEPQPLPAKVAPEPYPLDALPGIVREAVIEVQGFVKAPVPLVASSALTSISTATQAHVDVRRADKLEGPTSLFLLSLADSGERKTTCDGFFTKVIRESDAQEADIARETLKKYDAELSGWTAEREGIEQAIRHASKIGKEGTASVLKQRLVEFEEQKPEQPRVPKFLRMDDTPEKLALVLAKEWPSVGVVSSEGGIILGAHAMGQYSIMRNLGLLNTVWDGGGLGVGRRTSESFELQVARLTIGLQVQEETLRNFLDQSGGLPRSTGFLARVLMSWPESTQGFRPFSEAPAAWPVLSAFNRRIAEILKNPIPFDDKGVMAPRMLLLTPEAKDAWIEFHDAVEIDLRSGGELCDVRDVASKCADNAVRLAALFQYFEDGAAGGFVELEAFKGASRIAAWHLSESRRFFGELALPAEIADVARFDAWLIAECRRTSSCCVGKRRAHQYGPLRDGAAVNQAIDELEDLPRSPGEGRKAAGPTLEPSVTLAMKLWPYALFAPCKGWPGRKCRRSVAKGPLQGKCLTSLYSRNKWQVWYTYSLEKWLAGQIMSLSDLIRGSVAKVATVEGGSAPGSVAEVEETSKSTFGNYAALQQASLKPRPGAGCSDFEGFSSLGRDPPCYSCYSCDSCDTRGLEVLGPHPATPTDVDAIRQAFGIEPPKATPSLVRCCDCASFVADTIGDGLGIGRCAVDGEGSRPQGRWGTRPALWARGERRCGDYRPHAHALNALPNRDDY